MNCSPHLEDNQLSEDSVTREGKSQQHSKRCRPRLRPCVQKQTEKTHQSRGGAASSTRPEVPRDAESAAAQQCRMSESEETQQRCVQEATDTAHDGLSQRIRGSREVSLDWNNRDESTGSVDDVNLDTKLEMSQR